MLVKQIVCIQNVILNRIKLELVNFHRKVELQLGKVYLTGLLSLLTAEKTQMTAKEGGILGIWWA